jgi:hypothetical protein
VRSGYREHIYDLTYRAVGACHRGGAVREHPHGAHPHRPAVLPGDGIPGWLFGVLYLVFEWYQGRRGGTGTHDAHIYGALFGVGNGDPDRTDRPFHYLQPDHAQMGGLLIAME